LGSVSLQPFRVPERRGCRQAEEPGELVLKGNRPVSGAAGHAAYLVKEGRCEGGRRGKPVAPDDDPVLGGPAPGQPFRVGIADPAAPRRLAEIAELTGFARATATSAPTSAGTT
jgi:hypothetical protein